MDKVVSVSLVERTRSGKTILYDDRVRVKTFPCHIDKVVIITVLGYLKEAGQRRPSSMVTGYKSRPSFVPLKRSYQYSVSLLERTRSGKTIVCDDRVHIKTFPCPTDKVVIITALGYLKEQGLGKLSSMMTEYK